MNWLTEQFQIILHQSICLINVYQQPDAFAAQNNWKVFEQTVEQSWKI